jgi:hypothetical protein
MRLSNIQQQAKAEAKSSGDLEQSLLKGAVGFIQASGHGALLPTSELLNADLLAYRPEILRVSREIGAGGEWMAKQMEKVHVRHETATTQQLQATQEFADAESRQSSVVFQFRAVLNEAMAFIHANSVVGSAPRQAIKRNYYRAPKTKEKSADKKAEKKSKQKEQKSETSSKDSERESTQPAPTN